MIRTYRSVRSRLIRITALAVLALAVLSAALLGCGAKADTPKPPPSVVSAASEIEDLDVSALRHQEAGLGEPIEVADGVSLKVEGVIAGRPDFPKYYDGRDLPGVFVVIQNQSQHAFDVSYLVRQSQAVGKSGQQVRSTDEPTIDSPAGLEDFQLLAAGATTEGPIYFTRLEATDMDRLILTTESGDTVTVSLPAP